MDHSEFAKLASIEINFIYDALEESKFDEDFDLISDVLYIYTNKGDYVINQHSPTQQIWLSSPVSNVGYFNYDSVNKQWRDKNDYSLQERLSADLNLSIS